MGTGQGAIAATLGVRDQGPPHAGDYVCQDLQSCNQNFVVFMCCVCEDSMFVL